MKKEDAIDKIHDILAHLSGQWFIEVDDSHWQIRTRCNDGRGLYFAGWDRTTPGKPDKFEISGIYPHTNAFSVVTAGSIGVSAAKTPAQIAADIIRRLMPIYLKTLQDVKDRIIKHEEYLNTNETLLKPFLDLLGEPLPLDYHSESIARKGDLRPHYKHIERIYLTSNKHVDIQLKDLPLDEAFDLVAHIASRLKPEPVEIRRLDKITATRLITEAANKNDRFKRLGFEVHSGWNGSYILNCNETTYDVEGTVNDIKFELHKTREKRLANIAHEA